MANPEHLEILQQGVRVWNRWRVENDGVRPNLSNAELFNLNLHSADFHRMNLRFADLCASDLSGADLSRADLRNAYLNDSQLEGADFSSAYLDGTRFDGANLWGANLTSAKIKNANFLEAIMGGTNMANVDLSEAKNLESVKHHGPSSIGVDTIYRSYGAIPEIFLRGCGVPDELITYMHSLIEARQAIQFYSCFISYSHQDEEFARHLYSRMRDEHLRVWFAPEEMKGGRKLHEQIFTAIHLHDKLLLVLSENSLQSEWVISEIRRARKAEREEHRRKLFPIRLLGMNVIEEWEIFDADGGKDLAIEIREYFIPDFSNWKDHDAFKAAFDRLLQDLRAAE